MADETRRDENTATDPNEGRPLAEADEVLVNNPAKVAHEDQVPATEKEAEESETRAGSDFEGAKTARELADEESNE
jgi:hypothetical protein